MSRCIQTGRIETHDIEQHNYSVAPWELRMQQMSVGQFTASFELLQINGILLTREHWSQQIIAKGATPEGFLALASTSTEKPLLWCGQEIKPGCVCYGFDAAEIDFQTPVDSDHWVILVPKDLLLSYLGEETTANVLPRQQVIHVGRRLTRRLFLSVDRAIRTFRAIDQTHADDLLVQTVEAELMETIMEMLVGTGTDKGRETPRKRFLACRRAILYAEKLDHSLQVAELAAAASVSQRVLEMGFKETLGISPQKFLRWSRLNHLHRDLHSAGPKKVTITAMANRWGFRELGRTAVEYKRLFGESPSQTLRLKDQPHGIRLVDALRTTPSTGRDTDSTHP
jgi:AraC family ethanolamine operon transcriptional activator